ncbi:unnamed protein product [Mytilus coruscus]|uniref:SGNH hydrolase-type esterase domain-containing protein n=1 Tax=Mytilus coruscus TaxID=42192 RepID=A0A6J8BM82_MYTCO|nr:unnamed protein product [Mytilus coruscus]
MPREKRKRVLPNCAAHRQENPVQSPENRRRRPRRAETIIQNEANQIPQQPTTAVNATTTAINATTIAVNATTTSVIATTAVIATSTANTTTTTGYNPSEFNTHSLRIGAATQSFLDGLDENSIKMKGRWKSAAYKGYLKDIWVIGSSIVTRASDHVQIRPVGASLELEKIGCHLVWIGMSGMKWQNLVSLVQCIINWRSIPFAVIIHCGGNDIGDTPCGELLHHMKFAIAILSKMLPGTVLVWSSILPRFKWRFSNNTGAMETTRRRINSGGAFICAKSRRIREKTYRF